MKEPIEITCTDVTGKNAELNILKTENGYTADADNLSKGVYFITIRSSVNHAILQQFKLMKL
jgi:hypothetical protein